MSEGRRINMTEEYISELKELGLALKYARRNAGFSIRKLSSECGVMPYQICGIENGDIGTTIHTLHRIFKALGTTMRKAYENLEMEEECV